MIDSSYVELYADSEYASMFMYILSPHCKIDLFIPVDLTGYEDLL